MPDDLKNFVDLANSKKFSLTVQSPEEPSERDSRLRRAEAEAIYHQNKDLALFVFTGILIFTTFAVSIYLILTREPTSELSKWATTVLTSIVMGFVGYMTGKAVEKK